MKISIVESGSILVKILDAGNVYAIMRVDNISTLGKENKNKHARNQK